MTEFTNIFYNHNYSLKYLYILMDKLNTHHYDGALNKVVSCDATREEKEEMFNRLIQDLLVNHLIINNQRSTAIRAVSIITSGIQKPENYDSTNGLYADNVLYHICCKLQEKQDLDILKCLSEQLSDIITSGSCPQGRVIRLVQVLDSINDIVA